MAGVNLALDRSGQTDDYSGFLLTLLADLMQIQCIRADDTDLLDFLLPASIKSTVERVAYAQNVSNMSWAELDGGLAELEFGNEEEQDKFIQTFEMLSLSGQRLYPTPDIYLGLGKPDQQLCSKLLELLSCMSDTVHQRGELSHADATSLVTKVWVGAIYLEAKIEDFGSFPNFSEKKQPLRCYLVEYDNGPWSWKFFWSKPGQYQSDGVFITNLMKEDPPRNGERYFNDASQDQMAYSVTLTLTQMMLHDNPAFMYRQHFDTWTGAFMGNLTPIDPQEVAPEWMDVFKRNAP